MLSLIEANEDNRSECRRLGMGTFLNKMIVNNSQVMHGRAKTVAASAVDLLR